ncbi:hypothetical protein H9P43_000522 [Blastocladiella emersonii ATCC 22665]|nr:hypothetical protein H9P43_000522 [Blastocladiella emersonii ATCC 22665]
MQLVTWPGRRSALAALLVFAALWWRRRAAMAAWDRRKRELLALHPFIAKHSVLLPVRGKQLHVVRATHANGPAAPTLVFLHGFGGNLNQYGPLMSLFASAATVVGIDNVGHGLSPDTGAAADYATLSMVADLEAAIQALVPGDTPFVLVCHSYGCCMGTHLAVRPALGSRILGMVFLTPKALISPDDRRKAMKQATLPSWLLTVFRKLDRWGGPYSASVGRYVGPAVPEAQRWRQLAWNEHLSNFQVQSMLRGTTWATPEDYARVRVPVLLLGGERDTATPPQLNLALLDELLSGAPHPEPYIFPGAGHQLMLEETDMVHAVATPFLVQYCGVAALDPARVVPQDPPAEKWGLKNYAKWQATPSVGNVITLRDGTVTRVRGMKVLRETDPVHSPAALAKQYPNVKLVVDISRDTPPYDPRSLVERGIAYRKVSTTSKIPPSRDEVADFILTLRDFWAAHPTAEICVHCHYGFNRTGLMLASFLVEEHGVPVADAIDAFAQARDPGIRHVHFRDELYLRYAPRRRVRSLTNSSVTAMPAARGASPQGQQSREASPTRAAAAVPIPASPPVSPAKRGS